VIPGYRVRLDLAAFLDSPDFQVRLGPLASRATEVCAGTLDPLAWALRVRPACRVTRVPRDPLASESRACKDFVDRRENMGSAEWWEGRVLWAPLAIANFAMPWLCRLTGVHPRRGHKLLAAPAEKTNSAKVDNAHHLISSSLTFIHHLIQFYLFPRQKLCS